jgi:hypothetical protein
MVRCKKISPLGVEVCMLMIRKKNMGTKGSGEYA